MSRLQASAAPIRRAVSIGAVAVALALASGCSAEEPAGTSSTAPAATAQVQRGDLTRTSTEIGTVGYGAATELACGLGGTLTALAELGATIGNGDELYRVDDAPVIRLLGELPAWRDLAPGVRAGTDVEQLEQAMVDLGYADGLDLDVDGTWTRYTTIAVKRWQKDVGLRQTGTIPLGRVVFTPTEERVAEQLSDVGDAIAPGTSVLALGATARSVQVELATEQGALAPVGAEVDLVLPSGTTAIGTVDAVEATPPDEPGGESALAVTITSDDDALADLLDGTTLRVRFVTVLAEDVLMVPVTALVALTGGGYAVEVVRDGAIERVPVEPGRYSGTVVEIVEGALAVGDEVVTTR